MFGPFFSRETEARREGHDLLKVTLKGRWWWNSGLVSPKPYFLPITYWARKEIEEPMANRQ